jgi:hypothetical protein
MTRPIYLSFDDLGEDGDLIAWATRGKKKAFVTKCFAVLGMASSLVDEFHLARTPDRKWWVLWRRPDPELEQPWHPIARVPTRGLGAADAADRMVRKVWTTEQRKWDLDRFSSIDACGLLERYRVEQIIDDLWPLSEPATHLRVDKAYRYDCDCARPISRKRCPICNAPQVFDRWVPFAAEDDRRQFVAIYGIEPHGRHRQFVEEFFAPYRTACSSCRGSGILGEPPADPVLCGDCSGLGGHWTCSVEALEAARETIAQVHPHAVAHEVPTIATLLVR